MKIKYDKRVKQSVFKKEYKVPALSMFYGIIIRMYPEGGAPHSRPHIHAGYGGSEAVIDLSGDVIEGELPKGKMRLILAWMEIHNDELHANWELLCAGEPAFKIDPLK